jgi:hypothetical protein
MLVNGCVNEICNTSLVVGFVLSCTYSVPGLSQMYIAIVTIFLRELFSNNENNSKRSEGETNY